MERKTIGFKIYSVGFINQQKVFMMDHLELTIKDIN